MNGNRNPFLSQQRHFCTVYSGQGCKSAATDSKHVWITFSVQIVTCTENKIQQSNDGIIQDTGL